MASSPDLYAFVRGEIVPLTRAYLHVSDLAIQRGYGIFDYFRVHETQPLFVEDHLDRFYESARLMQLAVPLTRAALHEVILELARRNDLALSGIKILLTGGYSPDGYTPTPGEASLVLIQQPLTMVEQAAVDCGIRIMSHEYVREVAQAKTINYTMGIRLIQRLQETGLDDVLYHQQSVVSEFPRSNFFIVRQDNTVVTPAENVLFGITRKKVLQLASRRYPVEEGPVTLMDIWQAKEAFLTNTTKRLLPVVELDGKPIGTGKPGEVTLALLAAFQELEQAELHVVRL
ncbi:aminotransferase class IV [Hymenobacter cavernae]|uniref:branched-chain-amino-acid transaminase n=1 Tax=Hymenobacter cavernae TaxID=2044852 RepID=A0ABQ1UBS6_9BACT|nr:aminotransferase class IV [Hymenobacter cavernae]GGF15332.1 branched chain amino acid aminotransferase [Hymenobacter cavernae]